MAAEGERTDSLNMPDAHGDARGARRIPHAHCGILGGGGDQRAIGACIEGEDEVAVADEQPARHAAQREEAHLRGSGQVSTHEDLGELAARTACACSELVATATCRGPASSAPSAAAPSAPVATYLTSVISSL